MMDRSYLAATVLLVALGSVLAATSIDTQQPSLTETLQHYQLNLPDTAYTVTTHTTDTIDNTAFTTVTGNNGSTSIELTIITNTSTAFADSYMEQKENEITSLYTATPAPYSGIPEREAPCNTTKPRTTTTTGPGYNKTLYHLYTDENTNYVCSGNEAQHRSTEMVLYCQETGTLVQAKELVPVSMPEENSTISKITCDGL